MKISRALWFTGLFAGAATAAPLTLGGREHVQILTGGGTSPLEVVAMLDPAAKGSRLQAENIQYVLGPDGMTVHFQTSNGNMVVLQERAYDRPLIRDQMVPRDGGGREHRPVISLLLCVANKQVEVPFILEPRDDYKPSMRIAAADVRSVGTIDASAKFLHEPLCHHLQGLAPPSTPQPD